MKFEVKNRFTGEVQFTADIDCAENASLAFKLGLSVKWAIKNSINLQEANLRGADLLGASLRWANLRGADLQGANLRGADLQGANLQEANLRGADLQGASLQEANLRGADLQRASLRWANLRGADLQRASLRWANLRGADLLGASLLWADLRWADLPGANLQWADLRWADLLGANLYVLQTDVYTCWIQKEGIRIGCKHYAVDEWFSFDDKTIERMDDGALAWWKKWKPVIQAIHATMEAREDDPR